jgi:hypothetical protein
MRIKVITESRDDKFLKYGRCSKLLVPENVGLFSGGCIWIVRLIYSSYHGVCLKHPQASSEIMTEK